VSAPVPDSGPVDLVPAQVGADLLSAVMPSPRPVFTGLGMKKRVARWISLTSLLVLLLLFLFGF
jgi:hypothetical protein